MIDINKLISESFKNKEIDNLNVYRLIKAEFLKAEKSGKFPEGLGESDQIKIIQKMADQRKDSIEQYTKAGRNDLVVWEERELNILNTFLPKEPGEEEIKKSLLDIIGSRTNLSMKDFKPILGELQLKFPGINAGKVSIIFKTLI